MTITTFYLWQESFYWCCNNDHLWTWSYDNYQFVDFECTIYFFQKNKLEIVICQASVGPQIIALPFTWITQVCKTCKQPSFSFLYKKSFSTPSALPSKYLLGSTLLNFLIDACYSCNQAILNCLKMFISNYLFILLKCRIPMVWRCTVLEKGVLVTSPNLATNFEFCNERPFYFRYCWYNFFAALNNFHF